MNWANTRALKNFLPAFLAKKKAMLNDMFTPIQGTQKRASFERSQYRHERFDENIDDTLTFIAYPVMESFQPDAEVAAYLGIAIYWRLFFSHILESAVGSFVCVQTLFKLLQQLLQQPEGFEVFPLSWYKYAPRGNFDILLRCGIVLYVYTQYTSSTFRRYPEVPNHLASTRSFSCFLLN